MVQNPTVWRAVVPFIVDGIKRSNEKYSVGSVYQDLLAGRAFLHAVWSGADNVEAVVVSSFQQYATYKSMLIEFLGGKDIAAWVCLLKELEDFAVKNGAEVVEADTRPGLAKFMPDYVKTSIHLEKRLVQP